MSRYSLNLPVALKQDAEQSASQQGISLNQFIVWAVAEKVGELRLRLDDLRFPQIAYRQGEARWPTPVLRGTGIRVQTIVLAVFHWEMSPEEVAEDYELTRSQISEALDFYEAHRAEIDAAIMAERELETASA